ncbi:MAG: imidazolonepropionase [Acidimicrobiia bacterium]|nr:imidazolonepropionase [Acidimicrobiia bacterium]
MLTNIGRFFTPRDRSIRSVEDAAIAWDGDTIDWAGPASELPAGLADRDTIDCEGRAVVPGFVDSHTHLVFGGDRSAEFARRLGGESYESLADGGGGIQATVAATRAAPTEELARAALARVSRMATAGTTTVEIKTGYGLDVEHEAKMLDVIDAVDADAPVDIVPTLLAAHAFPRGVDRVEYVRFLVDELVPALADRVAFCDVFCDPAAFSVEESARVLEVAAKKDLGLRVHADQLSHGGGAALAASLGAASADHLDHAAEADLDALRRSGTVAVLVPGASLSSRLPFVDAAAVWQTGVEVAIATDCNPGTSYLETMPFVIALAVLEMGMSPDQALWAATRGGARSLRLDDRGAIEVGARADLVVLEGDHHVDLSYRPDGNHVRHVIAGGVPLPG